VPNAEEERVQGFLLGFVDFLYAVLFGVILQQTYSDVLLAEGLQQSEKLVRILLVIGVFYFLLGDWIQGRLLTLRNPYRGYRRFFVEIMVAFAGYGAAIEALRADILFVVYIMLVLFLGAYWARSTLRELLDERDFRELRVIMTIQSITAVTGGTASLLWYWYVGQLLSFGGMAMLYVIGWLYDLSYDLFAPSREGLAGGPAVPFMSDRNVERLRRFLRIPV
jgi:hypothetical protein